jgi:hypothetical protein
MCLEHFHILKGFSLTRCSSLTLAGETFTGEVVTLCILLSRCGCKSVPAFLFVRPYFPKRRWQANGELALVSDVSEHIPNWPRAIFQRNEDLGDQFRFHPRNLGLFDGFAASLELGDFYLSRDAQALIRYNVLDCYTDLGLLHFRINEKWKEQIRRECPDEYFVPFLLDLAILVIHAFPEPYADCLWRILYSPLKDVMNLTVIPFLSVAGPEDVEKLRYEDFDRKSP